MNTERLFMGVGNNRDELVRLLEIIETRLSDVVFGSVQHKDLLDSKGEVLSMLLMTEGGE